MEWISVKDRLPEKEGYVLIIYGKHLPFIAMYCDGDFYSEGEIWNPTHEIWHPTHWMPLPDPPKEY